MMPGTGSLLGSTPIMLELSRPEPLSREPAGQTAALVAVSWVSAAATSSISPTDTYRGRRVTAVSDEHADKRGRGGGADP